MENRNSSKNPLILDKVASLTTIRDIDIFEFSFMQTLADMLRVEDISFYKFNNHNEPCRLIRYISETESIGGREKTKETREVQIENITVPDLIKRAMDWIDSTGKLYSTKIDNEFVSIYPVHGLNKIVGYLSVAISHELSEHENLIISSLLSISQNFHGLLEENQKDKLTGLLNRKTFDDNISKIQNILATETPDSSSYSGDNNRIELSSDADEYWLTIIDIDFFKRINDSYGHVYGDEVLLMLSQVMKQNFRPHDLLFRFGGEEFVVIVKVNNQKEAKLSFERFRKSIEDFSFPQVGQVTISLGATLIMEQHAIASDIVGRADQALYHAKNNGRNKLFFYEDLIDSGIFEEKIDDGEIELF
ncbi:MAG: diguanylate cyclase [Methylophaga sp.]|nr:diguanylate cyclase [Methylophaga sp.]